MKIGDRIRRNKQSGTVTAVYPPSTSGTVLVEWKSCGRYYVSNATVLELIPAEHKPRWRIER